MKLKNTVIQLMIALVPLTSIFANETLPNLSASTIYTTENAIAGYAACRSSRSSINNVSAEEGRLSFIVFRQVSNGILQSRSFGNKNGIVVQQIVNGLINSESILSHEYNPIQRQAPIECAGNNSQNAPESSVFAACGNGGSFYLTVLNQSHPRLVATVSGNIALTSSLITLDDCTFDASEARQWLRENKYSY